MVHLDSLRLEPGNCPKPANCNFSEQGFCAFTSYDVALRQRRNFWFYGSGRPARDVAQMRPAGHYVYADFSGQPTSSVGVRPNRDSTVI